MDKKIEEIVNYAKRNKDVDINFNLLEQFLFYTLRRIIEDFYDGHISSKECIKRKDIAIQKFIQENKSYSFYRNMYLDSVDKNTKASYLKMKYYKDGCKDLDLANQIITLLSREGVEYKCNSETTKKNV